jgi:DNA-binding winged helix-turn-helix (wHTH) protein
MAVSARGLETVVTTVLAFNKPLGKPLGDGGQYLQYGTTTVWPAHYAAVVGDRHVSLTKNESAMLLTLIAAGGVPVRRRELAAVWGPSERRAGPRSVDTRIYALRRKLGDSAYDPRLIVTVPGIGYAIHLGVIMSGGSVGRPRARVGERIARVGEGA